MEEISDSNYENTGHGEKREHLSESMEEIIRPIKKHRVNDSYSDSQNYKGVVQQQKRERLSESMEEIIRPIKKHIVNDSYSDSQNYKGVVQQQKRERLSESVEEIIRPIKKHRVNDSYSDSQNYKGVVQQHKRERLSESMEEILRPIKKHRVNDSYSDSQSYKGVVQQQNGKWGAQIYTNNQRIWIGTFGTELDAAIAYDRASIKLRSSDAPRNFPWSKKTVQEAKFQSLYTPDSILAMIKDGSYQSEFDDFLREKENDSDISVEKSCGFSPRLLFEKQLTPSDVGKLNRLVIPKKHAVRYFPRVPDTDKSQGLANDEVHLSFYDLQKRLWKFRYCYWKSSQSFVFTKGWNLFVKEKRLVAKDTISIYFQENPIMQNSGFWILDKCLPRSNTGASLKLGLGTQVECVVKGEEHGNQDIKSPDSFTKNLIRPHAQTFETECIYQKLRFSNEINTTKQEFMGVPRLHDTLPCSVPGEEGSIDDHETKAEVIQTSNVLETKGFKLFGVQIV